MKDSRFFNLWVGGNMPKKGRIRFWLKELTGAAVVVFALYVLVLL